MSTVATFAMQQSSKSASLSELTLRATELIADWNPSSLPDGLDFRSINYATRKKQIGGRSEELSRSPSGTFSISNVSDSKWHETNAGRNPLMLRCTYRVLGTTDHDSDRDQSKREPCHFHHSASFASTRYMVGRDKEVIYAPGFFGQSIMFTERNSSLKLNVFPPIFIHGQFG